MTIEREDLFRCRVIDDGIRIVTCFNFTQNLQRLQVEYGRGVCFPVAGEAAIQFRCDRNSVDTGSVRNIANYLVGVKIDDHYMCATGDVETPRRSIHSEIIPATLPANG